MLTVVVTVGLALLLVAGVMQLSSARLTGPNAKRDQLVSADVVTFTPADYREPARILADGAKLRNGLVVLLEAASIAMAVWMVAYVFAHPGIWWGLEVGLGATLLVGALLVGRGMYIRLGLYRPTLETVRDYRESLAETFGSGVAADFADIHAAMSTARGEGLDEVTVGVLAAARNEHDLAAIAEWGEGADVADRETFRARADRLAEAGLIEREDGTLRIAKRLRDADNDGIASVAASVVN